MALRVYDEAGNERDPGKFEAVYEVGGYRPISAREHREFRSKMRQSLGRNHCEYHPYKGGNQHE